MARTNVLTTAKRIRRQCTTGFHHAQVVLAAAIDDEETTLSFTGLVPNALVEQAVLGIDTEMLLVVSVNEDAFTAVVIRGYMDSEAAEHVIGSMVDINPRFSLLQIVDAMRSEIATWSPRLFYADSATFTVDTSTPLFELPAKWAESVGVLAIKQRTSDDASGTWPLIAATFIRGTRRGFDSATASGLFLRFTDLIQFGSIYLTVAMPFDPEDLPVDGDLIDDYNLTEGLLELLELGVKKRLVLDEQIGKQQRHAQDDSRRAEETPIGSLVPLGQVQLAQYSLRFEREAARLARFYPMQMS